MSRDSGGEQREGPLRMLCDLGSRVRLSRLAGLQLLCQAQVTLGQVLRRESIECAVESEILHEEKQSGSQQPQKG